MDIFKNANFNILMLSLAGTGWILYILEKYEDVAFVVALICSMYCVFAFIVAMYNWAKTSFYRTQERKNMERRFKEEEDRKNYIHQAMVYRMFYGLTEEHRNILRTVVLQGRDDEFNCNVKHFDNTPENRNILFWARSIATINQTPYNRIQYITIDEHPADIVVTMQKMLLLWQSLYGKKWFQAW